MKRETIFSPCRQYRYTLWREWPAQDNLLAPLTLGAWDAARADYLMVIGLNPSTADETKDDPTIRRCIAFAKAWGFGALCMTNLFAWRDTLPSKMKLTSDPVGPLNDYYLNELAKNAGMILAAWGSHGSHNGRASYIRDLFKECGFTLHHLRANSDGSPGHPLYIPANTKPVEYAPKALAL